jgi:mannose-6-phosphate isomerase-like protein (cupin superfamily)
MLQHTARCFAICVLIVTIAATPPPRTTSFTIYTGVQMTLELASSATHGRSAILKLKVRPGDGPAAHIHTREDETYIVLHGHFRFWHGNRVVDATDGDAIYLPRNEPHQWRNVGTATGEEILILSPAGLEQFFITVAARKLQMPRDLRAIQRLQAKYGITRLKRSLIDGSRQ